MFSQNNGMHEAIETGALAAFMGADTSDRPDLFGELEPLTDMSHSKSQRMLVIWVSSFVLKCYGERRLTFVFTHYAHIFT